MTYQTDNTLGESISKQAERYDNRNKTMKQLEIEYVARRQESIPTIISDSKIHSGNAKRDASGKGDFLISRRHTEMIRTKLLNRNRF